MAPPIDRFSQLRCSTPKLVPTPTMMVLETSYRGLSETNRTLSAPSWLLNNRALKVCLGGGAISSNSNGTLGIEERLSSGTASLTANTSSISSSTTVSSLFTTRCIISTYLRVSSPNAYYNNIAPSEGKRFHSMERKILQLSDTFCGFPINNGTMMYEAKHPSRIPSLRDCVRRENRPIMR